MTNSLTKTIFLLFGVLALASLGACGKKANHVFPPDDLAEDNYPYIYPDPATDPGSHAEPQHQFYEKQAPQQQQPQAPTTQDQP